MVSSANALSSSIFLTFRQKGSSLETSVGPWRAAGVPDVHRALPQREYGRTKVSDRPDSSVRDILASQGATSSQISTVTRTRLSLRFLPVSRESDIRRRFLIS